MRARRAGRIDAGWRNTAKLGFSVSAGFALNRLFVACDLLTVTWVYGWAYHSVRARFTPGIRIAPCESLHASQGSPSCSAIQASEPIARALPAGTGLTETWDTLEILAKHGYEYVCDRVRDHRSYARH